MEPRWPSYLPGIRRATSALPPLGTRLILRLALRTAGTFDTLAATDRLRDAGFDDGQARAIVEIHRDAGAELATKGDLANLHAETKADLAELRADLHRASWIQAAALIGTQLATAGFVVHLLSQ